MRKDITTGAFGTNLKLQTNDNFKELYQNTGHGIEKFTAKVRSYKAYKDETIRVSIWGDSIWNYYEEDFETMLQTMFPLKTFEFRHAHIGGTGTDYQSGAIWDVINFNPDLIMFGEYESFGRQQEMAEFHLNLIKQLTSADILITPWTIYKSDMYHLTPALYSESQWKASESYHISQWFYAMKTKYGCGMADWTLPMKWALLSGDETPDTLTRDGVHPSDLFYSNYVIPFMESFFYSIFKSENISNFKSNSFKTILFGYSDLFPDLAVMSFTKSGTWLSTLRNLSNTVYSFDSSDISGYVQENINGIGFELAYFGSGVGVIGLLIDGVAPSTFMKNYASFPGNATIGLQKVIIDTNILNDSETSRQFSVTLTSLTDYTLRDVTNGIIIGTGTVNVSKSFAINGGQLTIPATYAGVPAWRSTFQSGDVYTFYIRKNYSDEISVTATNLTHVVRIFGLERGDHTIRIKCNSGTISLDSIMELK